MIAVGTTATRPWRAQPGKRGSCGGDRRTELFIYPGYRFKVVDALLTIFTCPAVHR